ncbi:MAG: PAS domain S-box protein, partial [Usitatibacter sp.]
MSAIAKEPSRIDLDLIREAFDRAPVGLAVMGPDGTLRVANRALCEMMGYARPAVEGKSFRSFVNSTEFARDEDYLRGIRGGAEPPPAVESRILRSDGVEVWVRIDASLIRDAAGEPRYIVSVVTDLTQQRENDRTLRQTNGFLSAIVENAPVAIYTADIEGVVNFWNPAAERTFGFTAQQAIGGRAPFIPESKRAEAQELRRRVVAGEVLHNLELVRQRADGSQINIHGAAAPLRDEADRVTGLLVACVDVTEARRATAELETHLHFTRALLDAIPNPVYFKDREGRYLAYNRAWREIFGRGGNWLGKTGFDIFDEAIAREHQERDKPLIERPSSTTYEAMVPDEEGIARQMLFNKVSFVDQSGDVAGVISVVTDVTRYKQTEGALEASEARFRILTESTIDLISVIDADGAMQYQSGALRSLLGFDPADSAGKNVFDLVHRDDVEHVRAAFRRILETQRLTEPVEFRLRHRDGSWRTFESLGTNCLTNPHIRGIVWNSRDVTDRKVIQQRIQHLAYHDNLTGLPNRGLLQDRLARSIARAERAGRKVAVLFIDLDNFKNINDTLGHDVGDELLRQVSRRLSECVRLEDTIARQGGDEFIVLLDNLDDGRSASVVAQKVLNALRQPLNLGGNEQHVSGSVGIALYPEDGRDAQTLMKNADTAMFHGKGLGKNTYQYFTAQMNIAVKR